jgi:hypothetical protein
MNQCQNFIPVQIEEGCWQFKPCSSSPLFIATQISTGIKKLVCSRCLAMAEKNYPSDIKKEAISDPT